MLSSERRKADRVRTRLEASWEGVLTRRTGTVTDLSPMGCFILTSDEDVKERELVRLEIESPTGRAICLWGEVIYRMPEMGIALRFTGSDPTEQKMLELLIDYLRDHEGRAQPPLG